MATPKAISGGGARALPTPPRRDPAVAATVRVWRRLTGGRGVTPKGRRTLVACSGGADSSFLVLALASAGADAVVAHVVHDLRPRLEALADRDAAAALAGALGFEFVQAEVTVRGAGLSGREARRPRNAEAAARRERYAALARLAVETGCSFVATAHQADDALEGMLMALMRGAGPRGLAGVAQERGLARGVTLIRPMLEVRRADSERVCRECSWMWREDATNKDESRLRSAVRHRVMPELERLRPGAAVRAARTARLQRGAAALVREQAAALFACAEADGAGLAWPRGLLRGQREVVLGELVRMALWRLRGRRGMDRAGWARVEPIVRAVRDRKADPRRFGLGGIEVAVRAHAVIARRL